MTAQFESCCKPDRSATEAEQHAVSELLQDELAWRNAFEENPLALEKLAQVALLGYRIYKT